MTKKSFKISIVRFFTRKLTIGIITLSLGFFFYTARNFLKHYFTPNQNIQLLFKNLIFSFLVYLILITLLLILKLIIERMRNVSGSKLRLRLTLLFIFVAFIPAIALTVSSNYLINEALNRINPGEEIIKPLESSLAYYRESLSSDINKETQTILKYSQNAPLTETLKYLSQRRFNDLDLCVVFQKSAQKINTLFQYNKIPKTSQKSRFYLEYFDDAEFEEPIIHKANDRAWIIFIIKYINKQQKVYLLTGMLLDKKKIAVAEGINAILEKYKSLKIISVSLIRDFQVFILLISIPVILLAVIIGFYLASEFTKPLNSLVEATKKISQGIYGYNIPAKATDELGQLIDAFNTMSHELYMNKNRLFEAEKLAAWREVAKKLAHEVKNPLTPIKLASERLIRAYSKTPEEFEKILISCSTTIVKEVDRLKDLVNEFSQFARFPLTNTRDENIIAVIDELLSIYVEANPGIQFQFIKNVTEEEQVIKIDTNQIKQVIINLIENAVECGARLISITAETVEKETRKFIRLSIKDNGGGIPKKYHSHIFEPHFTSKKRGSGLGLSIVKNIIEEHRGIIYFQTEENTGTTFIIELPYFWRVNEQG